MRKVLVILTILFVIGVLAFTFIPRDVYAWNVSMETMEELRDPHFHSGEWTTCMNQLKKACADEEVE